MMKEPVRSGSPMKVHTAVLYKDACGFSFPEAREIEASNWLGSWVRSLLRFEMQGSNDTTNGMDGTWETAVFPSGTPMGSHTVPSCRESCQTCFLFNHL